MPALSTALACAAQVEFGAHQVILVRNMDSIRALPWELQESRAIIMTVSQSKGLEFDDVFLVDFFHDSPAESEWRVLTSFIEEIEVPSDSPASAPQPRPQSLRLAHVACMFLACFVV